MIRNKSSHQMNGIIEHFLKVKDVLQGDIQIVQFLLIDVRGVIKQEGLLHNTYS